MIKINKSNNPPNILANDGLLETEKLKRAYTANPQEHHRRVGVPFKQMAKMVFDEDLYGDTSVKDQLIFEQYDKCCFCEGKFSDNSYGDVEHYRPKGAYRKRNDKCLTYPGYYWLAYDWNNLMYSCEICNRTYKGTNFPLDNEATRKPYHSHPNLLSNEDRLLINPIEEDPSAFITFREEVPVPVRGSLKGELTIKIFGLERLNNARLENIKAIKIALTLVELDENDPNEISDAANALNIHPVDLIESVLLAKELFNLAAKNIAKFSYCVRCNFPQLPTA